MRFQLSHASAKGKLGQEHSIWISDLTADVTERQLERSFATRGRIELKMVGLENSLRFDKLRNCSSG